MLTFLKAAPATEAPVDTTPAVAPAAAPDAAPAAAPAAAAADVVAAPAISEPAPGESTHTALKLLHLTKLQFSSSCGCD